MKNLYILICSRADGSSMLKYTLNPQLIQNMQSAADKGFMSDTDDPGMDSEGFRYHILSVPVDSTYDSLSIRSGHIVPNDYCDKFKP